MVSDKWVLTVLHDDHINMKLLVGKHSFFFMFYFSKVLPENFVKKLVVKKNISAKSEFEKYIENIFVQFGGRLFRQMIGIPMGTNCAPLLAGLFLYSYENEFLDNMIRSDHRRLAISLIFTYCSFVVKKLVTIKHFLLNFFGGSKCVMKWQFLLIF